MIDFLTYFSISIILIFLIIFILGLRTNPDFINFPEKSEVEIPFFFNFEKLIPLFFNGHG